MSTPIFPTSLSLAPVAQTAPVFQPARLVPSHPAPLSLSFLPTDVPSLMPISSPVLTNPDASVFESPIFEPSELLFPPVVGNAPVIIQHGSGPVEQDEQPVPLAPVEPPTNAQVLFNPSNPGFAQAQSTLNQQQQSAQRSLVGCSGRPAVRDICRFNNLECCTERLSATVFVPDGNDNAPCYEARDAFDSLSADWTDAECEKVRLDVEKSGGIGCACTTEPEEDLACAQRDLDYQVCDFDVPPSRLKDCCSPDDSLLVDIPEGTLVVKCAFANATLYGDDSILWPDSQCQAVREAILDHALQNQGCACPVRTQPPAAFVLTNPPTPTPQTTMPSSMPSFSKRPTTTAWSPSLTPSNSTMAPAILDETSSPMADESSSTTTAPVPPIPIDPPPPTTSGVRSSRVRWHRLLLVGTAVLLFAC